MVRAIYGNFDLANARAFFSKRSLSGFLRSLSVGVRHMEVFPSKQGSVFPPVGRASSCWHVPAKMSQQNSQVPQFLINKSIDSSNLLITVAFTCVHSPFLFSKCGQALIFLKRMAHKLACMRIPRLGFAYTNFPGVRYCRKSPIY